MMSGFRHLAACFSRDARGGAAVEFAIIAPVMLLIFFGTVEVSEGISADRKVKLAARTISDLVARKGDVDDTELRNVFTAASHIIRPFPLTDFKATISQISMNAQGTPSVIWKVNLTWSGNSASLTNTSDKTVGTIPNDLKVADTRLIKSDVTYPYQSVSAFFISSIPLASTFFARPRKDSGRVCYVTACS